MTTPKGTVDLGKGYILEFGPTGFRLIMRHLKPVPDSQEKSGYRLEEQEPHVLINGENLLKEDMVKVSFEPTYRYLHKGEEVAFFTGPGVGTAYGRLHNTIGFTAKREMVPRDD